MEFVEWVEVCETKDVEFYKHILSQIQYNEDCYRTNKFVHFKNMLDEKGFKNIQDWVVCQTTVKQLKEIEEEHKQLEIENFDIAKPCHIKRNEILKIPEDQMKTYCQLFLNDTAFTQYRNVRKYLINNSEVINTNLQEKEDFNVNKVKTADYKIVLIQKFLKYVESKDKFNFQSQKQLTKEEAEKWFGYLEAGFRFRCEEKPDFTQKEEVDKYIIKCFRQLFGGNFKKKHEATESQIATQNNKMTFAKTNLVSTTRKTVGGKKISILKLNKKYFDEISNVVSFSFGQQFKWNSYTAFEDSENGFITDDE